MDIAALRQQHLDWQQKKRVFGTIRQLAILRVIAIGYLEKRPFDLTSLAVVMSMSRPTLTRRVEQAVSKGWVTMDETKCRHVLIPTSKCLDALCKLLQALWIGGMLAGLWMYTTVMHDAGKPCMASLDHNTSYVQPNSIHAV